jgi:hypothetical protein
MIARKILLTAATLGALSPVLTYASPEKASVQACAKAFAGTLPTASSSGFTLRFRPDHPGSVLSDYYATEYTFTLEAHAAKTGAPIARAVCSTNSRGEVTSISTSPLEAKSETLAGGIQ